MSRWDQPSDKHWGRMFQPHWLDICTECLGGDFLFLLCFLLLWVKPKCEHISINSNFCKPKKNNKISSFAHKPTPKMQNSTYSPLHSFMTLSPTFKFLNVLVWKSVDNGSHAQRLLYRGMVECKWWWLLNAQLECLYWSVFSFYLLFYESP